MPVTRMTDSATGSVLLSSNLKCFFSYTADCQRDCVLLFFYTDSESDYRTLEPGSRCFKIVLYSVPIVLELFTKTSSVPAVPLAHPPCSGWQNAAVAPYSGRTAASPVISLFRVRDAVQTSISGRGDSICQLDSACGLFQSCSRALEKYSRKHNVMIPFL